MKNSLRTLKCSTTNRKNISAFSWRCPYCRHNATIGNANFHSNNSRTDKAAKFGPLVVRSELIVCPNPDCGEIALETTLWDAEYPQADLNSRAFNKSGSKKYASWSLIPASRAIPYPDYVPASIRADHEEACAIEQLSPKASATLARRAVQGIIRGFYKITKARLIDEIDAVEDNVDPKVFQAIHALREMGNIGAHPEKDVDAIVDVQPEEAHALIDLVELFIEETYVADNERQRRLAAVTKAAADRKALKAKKTATLPPTTS